MVFTTTAVAATLVLTTQPSASASAGVAFERQPVLQLLDQTGVPIARAGVVVTVQIATGGGTLGGTTSRSSDAAGTVTFTDLSIRGSPGTRTLIFAADGVASAASAPVALGVGAATSIAAAAGDGQTATVNTTVALAPAVVVRDLDGNPVAGVPVVFTVTAGGGSVTGGTAGTDAEGIARVGGWRLGTAAGPNGLRARVEGAELAGNPVAFAATGTAGPVSAERSTIAAAPPSITTSSGSSASTVTVTARDEFDNPVPGRTVTLAASGSNNTVTQPSQPTDASGVATGKLSASTPGTRTVSAQIDGAAIGATATVTVAAGAPSAPHSSASAGNGTAGAATVITVQLNDQFGNPVAGQGAKLSAQITGANAGSAGAAQDQGGGSYSLSYTPLVVGTDQITVRLDGVSLPSMPLASTVTPGSASLATSTAVIPEVWRILVDAGDVPVVVTVRDAHGNVRSGLTDQVEVQVDGGATIQATANGDGTYSASFPPPRLAEDIPVVVRLNGGEIDESPYLIDIRFF
ncbi:MAG TPA: invasin domain 3-containing protein [Gemmatimonadales bacterium]|nr:invasin domain 3-containing protein [Gemmatimonadales bacterium]